VLSCVSICCVYCDTTSTIQTELVVMVCLKYNIKHNTNTSSILMVSPRTQHIKTQFSTYNFINILCVKDLKLLFKTEHFIYKLNYFDVLCDMSFKEHLPEDGYNRWPKHVAGYAVCNTINLNLCVCTGWSYFS